ncbi:MAG: tRNA (adenosine(37)-N6)-threonylcarbamoyltransferase complex ATPase subunit type 1 TsaE [Nitrospirae bacterium]|nr:tRNA (adenosine(37)-N6)-threonylcarbamoyltransferase complex ATPase subunit type 1 TsaE [Nitrospirota bacterium]
MKLTGSSPEDTEAIGYKLGRLLKAGDVVGLYGDLGTGKTTMVKGIARAFGIGSRDVTSASFTIIAEYASSPPFYHIDLYRIERGSDLDDTGIWDCLGRESVAVIEWAERIGDELSRDFIKVFLTDLGDGRREIAIDGIHEEDWNNL